jgi:hypothetical protein
MYRAAPGGQPVQGTRHDGALIAHGVVIDMRAAGVFEHIGHGGNPGVRVGFKGGAGHVEVVHHHHRVNQPCEHLFAKMLGLKASADGERLAVDRCGNLQLCHLACILIAAGPNGRSVVERG